MTRIGFLTLLIPLGAFAQLAPPNRAGVSMGHIHFLTNNPEAQRRFWTMLGAKPAAPLGANEVFDIQGVKILIRRQGSSGGSEGSIVHHIGFKVADFDKMLAACRAANLRILTPPDAIAKNHKANVMGPEDINVELVSDASLRVPIAFHHVHFYNSPVEDTRAWYVKTFGAIPGKRDVFEAADVPGANLSFSASKTKLAPTKGRVLDHIGFEVKNLEAFCKKLESQGVKFDRPFTNRPDLGISLAFIYDPWGTYIELTEGTR